MTEKAKKILLEIVLYVMAFFVSLLLFLTLKPLILVYRKGTFAQSFIVLSMAVIIALIAYMGITNKLNTKRIVFLLLLLGFILRVGYMLYTPAPTRQQDTYTKNFDGHEAYAWTLFDTGKLPTHNGYQFYHPPLNAFVQAGFMHFISGLTELFVAPENMAAFLEKFNYAKPSYITSNERYYLYSACQILAVMYSFITAVVLVKTVWLFDFSNKTKLILAAFVVLYPRQIQFSGQLNNDGIAYMFAVLALYYALKWQKGNKAWGYITACGFAVGLGMMAKLSSATVCLPIAGVFIYEFVCTLRKKEGAISLPRMIGQYALFLAICAPIGLWFQVYAKGRFGQEFGFVFSNLNHKLYTGDHSFFERFVVAFDLREYLGSIYCRPFEGHYNLFNYALRSSIFGEFSYWQGEGFAVTAIVTAWLLSAALALSLVWAIILCVRSRKEETGIWKRLNLRLSDLLFVFLLVQSQVLSEIYFYIKMPYGCTMDFRYIMPLILGIGLLLGYTRKILAADRGKFSLVMNRLTLVLTTAFLTSSTLFYCVCI